MCFTIMLTWKICNFVKPVDERELFSTLLILKGIRNCKMANVRLDGYSLRIVDLVNILTENSIKVEISLEAIKAIEKSSEIIKSTTKLLVILSNNAK